MVDYFNAGIDFRCQILTSKVGLRAEGIKVLHVPNESSVSYRTLVSGLATTAPKYMYKNRAI